MLTNVDGAGWGGGGGRGGEESRTFNHTILHQGVGMSQ